MGNVPAHSLGGAPLLSLEPPLDPVGPTDVVGDEAVLSAVVAADPAVDVDAALLVGLLAVELPTVATPDAAPPPSSPQPRTTVATPSNASALAQVRRATALPMDLQ